MNIPFFKYYEKPEVNAITTQTKCQYCNSDENCLEGEYFDCGSSVFSVCINCLSKGEITVCIPDFINSRIKKQLSENGIGSEELILKKANQLIAELGKNPPVPWIQYNDWPVCCNDFMRYKGEWDQFEITQKAQDISIREYLLSILDSFSKNKINNFDLFWDDIGYGTSLFVFECINCSKIVAVSQSY